MVHMFDWDLLRSFLAVARAGKLTAAARQLKIDHSTLSRRIVALENSLGTMLFERRLSGYTLTIHGETLLSRAEVIESSIFGIQADVSRDSSQIAGTVRIGSPDGFGTMFLAPRLGDLSSRHPNLNLELVAVSRNFSLSKREADIVIMLSRPTYGRLHSRHLTRYELGVYGPRNDEELNNSITTLNDLIEQPFISYIEDLLFAPELDYLPLVSRVIQPKLRSASLIAQKEAAAAGAGFCILPCFIADRDARLTRVLPEEVRIFRSLWLTVHTDLRELARVRTTMDFIVGAVARESTLFLPLGDDSSQG